MSWHPTISEGDLQTNGNTTVALLNEKIYYWYVGFQIAADSTKENEVINYSINEGSKNLEITWENGKNPSAGSGPWLMILASCLAVILYMFGIF